MSAQAAEIYNKDSNKLDLYEKLMLSTTSPLTMQMMATQLCSSGFQRRNSDQRSTDWFRSWEYEFKGNRTEEQGAAKDKTVLHLQGLNSVTTAPSITVVLRCSIRYRCMDWRPARIRWSTWTQTDVFMTGRTTGVATYLTTTSLVWLMVWILLHSTRVE